MLLFNMKVHVTPSTTGRRDDLRGIAISPEHPGRQCVLHLLIFSRPVKPVWAQPKFSLNPEDGVSGWQEKYALHALSLANYMLNISLAWCASKVRIVLPAMNTSADCQMQTFPLCQFALVQSITRAWEILSTRHCNSQILKLAISLNLKVAVNVTQWHQHRVPLLEGCPDAL